MAWCSAALVCHVRPVPLWAAVELGRLSTADLVGQSARVVVTIPAGGVGQVRCQVGEELIDKIARAGDDSGIPENSVVRVEEVLGEVVIVRKH